MENSLDADLNFGDFVTYAQALGKSVRIFLTPGNVKRADHIRFLASCIKHELDELVKLAGDDQKIGDGIESFAIDQMQKMVTMIVDSIDKLPHRAGLTSPPVSVEVEENGGKRMPIDSPKRKKRKATLPA